MKNVLAIETSGPVLSVALKTPKSEVSEIKLDGFLKHAENLLPMIDQLLGEKKLRFSDVTTLLIGRGPGSFTGLRIGFATVKGFLSAGSMKVYGGLSLDMIAENVHLPDKRPLAVCLDARRDRFYFKLFQKTKTGWRAPKKVKLLTLEEMISEMPETVLVCGDALLRHTEKIETFFNKKYGQTSGLEFLPESVWYPRAGVLIDWFTKGDARLKELKTPREMLPHYIRLSEPEEKQKKHVASIC